MPPPAPEVLLPNTSVLFKVRVPSRFPMPPPPTGLFPPVMLRRFKYQSATGAVHLEQPEVRVVAL